MRFHGFRQTLAAFAFRFCGWRADAAVARAERESLRSEAWEDRARRCRHWSEEPIDRTQPF